MCKGLYHFMGTKEALERFLFDLCMGSDIGVYSWGLLFISWARHQPFVKSVVDRKRLLAPGCLVQNLYMRRFPPAEPTKLNDRKITKIHKLSGNALGLFLSCR
jgi:hypothetical protein